MMKREKNWAIATFILCFLVIIAGAVVRTTQSGMGCPDWPTCFGRWIPPLNASQLPADFEKYLRVQDIDHSFNVWHTWIEWFNRLLGTLLGLFAIIQLLFLYFKRKDLAMAFRLSAAFLGVVILTGLFGAVVVKLNLAVLSISVHLLFAVVLLEIQLALLLSVKGRLFSLTPVVPFKRYLYIFLIILLIQSVLGTSVRMYVDEVSKNHFEHREAWLAAMPLAFIIHRSFSWLVLVSVLFLAWKFRSLPLLNKKIRILSGIVIVNMIAGIILFYADMPAVVQPIHLFLATCAITQTFNILLQLKREGQEIT